MRPVSRVVVTGKETRTYVMVEVNGTLKIGVALANRASASSSSRMSQAGTDPSAI
jgi:hypothetical protein